MDIPERFVAVRRDIDYRQLMISRLRENLHE